MAYKSDSILRKNGIVYLIHALDSDFYKIGWSLKNPQKRLESMQTGCPYELHLAKMFRGSQSDEYELHMLFVENRYRGEWFVFDEEEVLFQFGYKKMIKKPEKFKLPNGNAGLNLLSFF